MGEPNAELRVGAHVLVQLGSELVTDVEQAILECVKNSYDADSPGCRIDVDTREVGVRIESGPAAKLRRFNKSSETVEVGLYDSRGQRLSATSVVKDDEILRRHLSYTGRITIEDRGDGLTSEQLQDSWLVISRSSKRGEHGVQKSKTAKGRTPLGDKGLGRLGSMKLGDILRIETATAPAASLATAQFRWADCESARTVDEIPVFVEVVANTEKFKGTRVSVLGLRDLSEWRRKDRINEITRSLARLISPFEATSTFPVGITLDGAGHSLVSVTEDVLRRAIAEFSFRWDTDPNKGQRVLVAEARFRKRLFTSERSKKQKDRTALIFGSDNGASFADALRDYGRLKQYDERAIEINGPWFIELKRTFKWSEMLLDSGAAVADPGPFSGAFYFFHLDNTGEPDEVAAAGIGVDRNLIKGMTGISILRDGFRVRSQGDWLELSSGMTSGSTYNMRVDNTIGYFALTDESNYSLIEKSDREGFVEDAAYRGFMRIALKCRTFANDALELVRRALDDHYRKQIGLHGSPAATTATGSLQKLEDNFRSAQVAKSTADHLAAQLQVEIEALEREAATQEAPHRATTRALRIANAAKAMDSVNIEMILNMPSLPCSGVRIRRPEHVRCPVCQIAPASFGYTPIRGRETENTARLG
jgi:hypothetical protein